MRILQRSICPFADNCQLFPSERPKQLVGALVRSSCLSKLKAVFAELIQLVVCDRSADPSWMFAFRIRQCSVKLAREGIELLEESHVHICIFTVVLAREPAAVCAKTDQLSSLFHFARGDHDDWLFLAVTVLAAHMLAQAFCLHVPFPRHRHFVITPWSLTHDYFEGHLVWW